MDIVNPYDDLPDNFEIVDNDPIFARARKVIEADEEPQEEVEPIPAVRMKLPKSKKRGRTKYRMPRQPMDAMEKKYYDADRCQPEKFEPLVDAETMKAAEENFKVLWDMFVKFMAWNYENVKYSLGFFNKRLRKLLVKPKLEKWDIKLQKTEKVDEATGLPILATWDEEEDLGIDTIEPVKLGAGT